MTNWFTGVRAETDYIIDAIKSQDFITKLIAGTLATPIFQYYLNQDSLYLMEYKKALALLAIKCTNPSDGQFFLDSAIGIIQVEDILHETFLEAAYKTTEPSPTCELYTSYLLRVVNHCSLEEGLAVVLPCFTIYKEIGDYILSQQPSDNNNPYQQWIDTYASEEFANAVNQAIEITEQHAAKSTAEIQEKMRLAFIKSSKLEWMFWDSANKQQVWPI